MSKDTRQFPPVGDDARYSAIVAKGRSIRHRRQAIFGTASGAVLAACVALVVVFSGNSGPEKSGQVFANEGKANEPKTQTTAVATDQMQLNVTRDDGVINIELDDPRMPVPTDAQAVAATSYRTQQCVLVTLADQTGQSAAEGFACQPFGPADTNSGTDVVSVQLDVTSGLAIGCSAVEERIDPVATEPQQMRSRFSAELPSGLAAGKYTLTVEAVSGFGDGCPDNPDPGAPSQPGDTGSGSTGANQVENTLAVQKSVTVSQ